MSDYRRVRRNKKPKLALSQPRGYCKCSDCTGVTKMSTRMMSILTAGRGGYAESLLRARCKEEKLSRRECLIKHGDPREWTWKPKEEENKK